MSDEAPASRVDPFDERDTFCTCPRCGCLAHHHVEVTVWRTRTIPGADGHPIDISMLQDPPDGTRIANRTCVICRHPWWTSATPDPEEADHDR